MIIMILLFSFLLTLCLYSIYSKVMCYNYWKSRNVIGPKPVPVFGNIKESVLRRKHLIEVYKDIYDRYGTEKVVGIYTMTRPALIIRDLDIVKHILIKDFNVFFERGIRFSKEHLGDNLFHCDNVVWKALRRKITPMFSSSKVKDMMPLVNEYGDKFVKFIENARVNSSLDLGLEWHTMFHKYTAATTSAAIFGLEIDTMGDKTKHFHDIDNSVFNYTYINEIKMLFPSVLKKTNTSLFGKEIIKFCRDIVKSGIKYRSEDSANILDVLLDLKDENKTKTYKRQSSFEITDDLIAAQVFILFVTGYENISSALSYAMYQLSKNIDIQHTVTCEIDTIISKYNGCLSYEALTEMTYLDKVFEETLRINTFATPIHREALKDYAIPNTDIVIEKGVTVIILPLAIHRDEKYYKDANNFDPERFTSEQARSRHSCAYLAFGAGPRSCFGIGFSKLLFKVVMVKIFSKYTVLPTKKEAVDSSFDPCRLNLKMKGGIHLNLIPKNLDRNVINRSK